MDRKREDLMYELQQALARMPRAFWRHYLAVKCPDADVCREVVRRQDEAGRRSMLTDPRYTVGGP
jgi:hypothetical protein